MCCIDELQQQLRRFQLDKLGAPARLDQRRHTVKQAVSDGRVVLCGSISAEEVQLTLAYELQCSFWVSLQCMYPMGSDTRKLRQSTLDAPMPWIQAATCEKHSVVRYFTRPFAPCSFRCAHKTSTNSEGSSRFMCSYYFAVHGLRDDEVLDDTSPPAWTMPDKIWLLLPLLCFQNASLKRLENYLKRRWRLLASQSVVLSPNARRRKVQTAEELFHHAQLLPSRNVIALTWEATATERIG